MAKEKRLRFRVLATLSVLLLSAPSALGVQRALAPTRGELAGWLAAAGIELAYLSLAFAAFADQRRQRLAARVARAAVLTAITLNVLADYAARVPGGLSSAAAFTASFDWLLLALSVLESAPLAALAYTLATLLHTHSSADVSADASASASALDATDANASDASASDASASRRYARASMQDASASASATMQVASDASASGASRRYARASMQDASYRCPRCAASLSRHQYAAARRYGYCAGCKRK
jgi:hypothetical protein